VEGRKREQGLPREDPPLVVSQVPGSEERKNLRKCKTGKSAVDKKKNELKKGETKKEDSVKKRAQHFTHNGDSGEEGKALRTL